MLRLLLLLLLLVMLMMMRVLLLLLLLLLLLVLLKERSRYVAYLIGTVFRVAGACQSRSNASFFRSDDCPALPAYLRAQNISMGCALNRQV